MRLVEAPRPLFLLLFVAFLLTFISFLQSISHRDLQFSLNPLFVFSLFNIIVVTLIVGNRRPSSGEDDDTIPFLYHPYELEDVEDAKNDTYLNFNGYDSGSDRVDFGDNDDEAKDDFDSDENELRYDNFDSDGYDEDDDDNGSDGEIGVEDMDEYDSNLEKRFQDFIDKVNRGWREERLRESLPNPPQMYKQNR